MSGAPRPPQRRSRKSDHPPGIKPSGFEPSGPGRVIVGEVRRPWGREGELAVTRLSDDGNRLETGRKIYLNARPARIVESRAGPKGSMVIRVDSVRSIDQAAKLRGALIEVDEADLPPPPEGSYYHYQVLGARVQTGDGEQLGKVVEIVTTGANDVYVVRPAAPDAAEILIPALRDVVLDVNVEAGTVTVDLPDGLR